MTKEYSINCQITDSEERYGLQFCGCLDAAKYVSRYDVEEDEMITGLQPIYFEATGWTPEEKAQK